MVFIVIPKIYSKYTLHTSFNNWEPIKMNQNDFSFGNYLFFFFNTNKIFYLIKNINFKIIDEFFISNYNEIICNYINEDNNISFNNIISVFNNENMKIFENDSILFDGFCLNNLPNGFGIIFNNENILFEGIFKNGVKHGKGIEYFNNQVLYKGEFKNDLFTV